MPLIVYLDSSDFSTLSKPILSSGEAAIRKQLLEWADFNQVQFVYSAVHLSEMAPLTPDVTDGAVARTELLSLLCRRNALVYPDLVIAAELRALSEGKMHDFNVHAPNGDWFPDLGDELFPPLSPQDQTQRVSEQLIKLGLDSAQRRQFFRTQSRQRIAQMFESAREASIPEIQSLYPMRQADARILYDYHVGLAKSEQAKDAFFNSMRDPVWLMRWFAKHSESLSPLGDWMREPAKLLQQSIQGNVLEKAMQLKAASATDASELQNILRCNQDDLVVKLILNRLLEQGLSVPSSVSIETATLLCPGLVTFFRLVHEMACDAVAPHPRKPKASDSIDGLHALYAPYVHVFRPDSYMGEKLKNFDVAKNTVIVRKLTDLLEGIRHRLTACERIL